LDCNNPCTIKDQLSSIVELAGIDLVAQAQTPGDGRWCATHPGATFRVIVDAAAEINDCCRRYSIPNVLLSTGSVFEGNLVESDGPYSPEDIPLPLSTYARSKWLAEKLTDGPIVRFGTYGIDYHRPKFYSRVYQSISQGLCRQFSCADDSWVSPVHVGDVAVSVIETMVKTLDGAPSARQIVHLTSGLRETVYDWATRLAGEHEYPPDLIQRRAPSAPATDVSLARPLVSDPVGMDLP